MDLAQRNVAAEIQHGIFTVLEYWNKSQTCNAIFTLQKTSGSCRSFVGDHVRGLWILFFYSKTLLVIKLLQGKAKALMWLLSARYMFRENCDSFINIVLYSAFYSIFTNCLMFVLFLWHQLFSCLDKCRIQFMAIFQKDLHKSKTQTKTSNDNLDPNGMNTCARDIDLFKHNLQLFSLSSSVLCL